MPKIVFIEPKAPGLHIFSQFPLPRLGTLILGTMMKKRGWEVELFVEDFRKVDFDIIAAADLVGISTITSTAPRAYAIAVSGVVRRYLERRFGLLAPRRSTEEFLAEARTAGRLDESHQRNLADFLAACDFLKFARATAEVAELEQIHATAVRFVTDTQPPPSA